MAKMVSYLRVSTAKQGRSGLGIEAQRAACARLAETEGVEIAAEFVEIETGKGWMPSTVALNWPLPWKPRARPNAPWSWPSSTGCRVTFISFPA